VSTQRQYDLRAVGAQFQIHGALVDARPYGTGHINDTFAATYDQAGTCVRYIHQRVNTDIFTHPDALMDNIARVLAHAGARVAGTPHAARRVLTLVPARDGAPFVRDEQGNVWRTYLFIEGARTFDVIESEAQAEAAARAFGAFQLMLADLPGARLQETIPRFHHTPSRFAACVAAIDADAHNRAAGARDAIDVVLARADDVSRLVDLHAQGDLPERVTHNDTKLNNVMIDLATGEGLCVIDLDTTMPGLAPYDFGDMVRTATNAAAEDEPDVTRVWSRPEMFDALARGYLGAAGGFLTRTEVEVLPFAGLLMTLECGMRFLADHLAGDTYFRIQRPGQNLDRARTQFALVASLESQREAQERVVRTYARG
jgi:hypothetical protein